MDVALQGSVSLAPGVHGQGGFTLFRMTLRARAGGGVAVRLARTISWSIEKRFSSFVRLRDELARLRGPPELVAAVAQLPPLPPKVWLGGSLGEELVETRREALARFLQRVVALPGASAVPPVSAFLEPPPELLMSSDDEDEGGGEGGGEGEEAMRRRQRAVLADARRRFPDVYDAAAVPKSELLHFIQQNADASFLRTRRLSGPPELVAQNCSRGRLVRAYKRLIGHLGSGLLPSEPSSEGSGAQPAAAQLRPEWKWHHSRSRPADGWVGFADADSVAAYYHATTGLVSYERHVLVRTPSVPSHRHLNPTRL